MTRTYARLFLAALAALSLSLPPSWAFATAVESSMDNDTDAFVPGAATTDRNYTQGAHVTWFDDGAPAWAAPLLRRLDRTGDASVRSGFSFGQEIYTPDAISTARFLANDRPYAGWLYGGAFVAVATERRERTIELVAGVVGPGARAEDVQSWWHRQWNVRAPRGWRWQLPNEPAFALRYDERFRPWGARRFVDLVPSAGLSLGTVRTDAHAAATFRLGWPLPDDFAAGATNAPIAGRGAQRALWAFARVEGRAVARDEFLDGPVFVPGPHVTRIPLVGEATLGAGARWHGVGFGYSFHYVTNEFRERTDAQEFGSFSIAF